jgi:hypothetical protein
MLVGVQWISDMNFRAILNMSVNGAKKFYCPFLDSNLTGLKPLQVYN